MSRKRSRVVYEDKWRGINFFLFSLSVSYKELLQSKNRFIAKSQVSTPHFYHFSNLDIMNIFTLSGHTNKCKHRADRGKQIAGKCIQRTDRCKQIGD